MPNGLERAFAISDDSHNNINIIGCDKSISIHYYS